MASTSEYFRHDIRAVNIFWVCFVGIVMSCRSWSFCSTCDDVCLYESEEESEFYINGVFVEFDFQRHGQEN
jgi:hypothetical protein